MTDDKQQTNDSTDHNSNAQGSGENSSAKITSIDADVTSDQESTATRDEELQQAREDVIRAQAEMMNVRKRAARDVENARKYALDRVVPELLEVFDSLEKGVEAAAADDTGIEQIREGGELTCKMLANVLRSNGVQTIDPTGQPFNPEYHQAMTMLPSAELEADTVIEVFQKGYSLNGRLIRPALVVVASKP